MSILQTIDLKKYYGEEPNITHALDGVNFSVDDGEFVAVVGTAAVLSNIKAAVPYAQRVTTRFQR